MRKNEERLRDALTASHQLAQTLDQPDFPLQALERLQCWQRQRLQRTYADLLEQQQYQAAAHFFLNELYGGEDFRKRDQEVERVMPIMTRFLPAHMLLVLARAFELQALSISLDSAMAAEIARLRIGRLTDAKYAVIYSKVGRMPERRAQLELIIELGTELIELVRHRMVLRLVRLLRGPARAAGFFVLQDFLEEGLRSFQAMDDGAFFIETIRIRETEFMQKQAKLSG